LRALFRLYSILCHALLALTRIWSAVLAFAKSHAPSLISIICYFQFCFFLRSKKMAVERTLSIIKPDAVAKNVIGKIYSRFESNGLKIIAARMAHLSRAEAEGFYAVHKGRPFFNDLVEFMTSGPVMIQALEGENAISKNRELMGATDPKKAEAGTIRADFAESIDANAVHGSDAAETAAVEIAYFFPGSQVYSR
jgi:nucleoside-diphosphate kinase